MTKQNEDLDSVIADLIDVDATDQEETSSDLPGVDLQPNSTDRPSISLTVRAARQILKIKKDENLDDDLYLRMAVEGGGCSGLNYKLGFDYKTDEDELFESQGVEIVVDNRHLMYLNGISIDYPDGLDARGFTFDNPNASESCGCGSSFAV